MASSVSNSISGGISFAGIGSGTDFSAMIAQLKQVEEIPKTRMTLWKGEWEYRIAAMEEVLKVMQEAKSALSEFDSISKMMAVSVDSSKEEVATGSINIGSDLTEGNYSIDVKQIATPSLFSTKKMFPEKTAIINDTGAAQEFSYTYKGTTRTIECPSGTTLDQLVLRINNDAKNPGVKASMIKNGSEYMFQIQGNSTGVDSELSISSDLDGFDSNHLFTANDVRINNTGSAQDFTLYNGSKSITMNIGADMTAGEFVEAFNMSTENPGLTASLVRDGADYVVQYKDKRSGNIVNPPTSSKIPALGGGGTVTGRDTSINNTGKPQTYTYTYLGTNYTVPVADDLTMEQLVKTINDDPNKAAGLTAVLDENPPGEFSIKMTKEDAMMNPAGGTAQEVSYKVDGKDPEYKMTVEPGTTMKEYVKQFNAHAKSSGSGVTAEIMVNASTGKKEIYYKKKDGTDVTSTITSAMPGFKDGKDFVTMNHDAGQASNLPGLGKKEVISGKDTIVNTGTANEPYSFTNGGKTYSASVPPGTTLDEFATLFNADPANAGVKAVVIKGASGYSLGFTDAAGAAIVPDSGSVTTNMEALKSGGDNWYEQKAQDAIVTVNGWPKEIVSSSNKLDEVIDGMTVTIKSEGKTQLSVSADSSKLKENIFEIVDMLNLVKGTILKLQEVDTDKAVGSPDEDVLTSQFTWQKGAALTGNYGVQMLLSEFSSITSSSGAGFMGMTDAEDTLNDTFTSLSQIGISTVTNPAEEDFGLLKIDSEKLDKALKDDANGIAELFSAKLTGATTSTDFTVASAGLFAKAGTYDVDYTVDDAGSVTEVFINGAKAQTDPMYPGRFTVADSKNDAIGLSVQFGAKLTPGTHKGDVRVKQGKVNEMCSFLGDELKRTSLENEPQGTLPTIISNYAEINENIQAKIDRETKRIGIWEERQKLKFSRLDTLLGEYNSKMESMANMLPAVG